MSRLNFTLEKTAPGSKARAARFTTLHGEVRTPVFMPVGTQATVKSQTIDTLKGAGSSVLLANTYHLLLRPGPEVFKKFGGIHRFMSWEGPVLTDSGGFQIFSLPHSRAMDEDGAKFKSYVDGTVHNLTPELSISMQRAIGSDIMMVLDQCIPSTAPYDQAEAAMHLTHRWAERSLSARGDSPQAMFGIVQGACHPELRKQSAAYLRARPFDGLAIGGLAVGETHAQRYEFTHLVTEHLPENLPRYLMGVGTPIDILEAVNSGVDMFDCIIPTQLAQRGTAFSSHGKMHIARTVYKFQQGPLDARCGCPTCLRYERGYLHHLVKTGENLGWHLLGQHNIWFYHQLMREIREAILTGTWLDFYERKRLDLVRTDEDNPTVPEKKPKAERAPQLGDYVIHTSEKGFSSIRQLSSGEIMHSVNRPEDEAQALYIDQSYLAARLLKRGAEDTAELVLWDVGLGAAHNAMAALRCFEKVLAEHGPAAVRPLRIESFECDLDPFKLAAKHPHQFPHLRHGAPYRLLENGSWAHASGLLTWELRQGDFLRVIETSPAPDVIFYDPFSAKTDTGLWTAAVFARIARQCGGKAAELYTYSNSTAVRVALLTAGFCVAEGVGTGPKATTTIGFTQLESIASHPLAPKALGEAWLVRWRRSGSKFPANLPESEQAGFAAQIEGNRQFKPLSHLNS
jgi:queuine tRNA-ribosyltransferase